MLRQVSLKRHYPREHFLGLQILKIFLVEYVAKIQIANTTIYGFSFTLA